MVTIACTSGVWGGRLDVFGPTAGLLLSATSFDRVKRIAALSMNVSAAS
jgi:hypothetical protein